MEVLENSIEVLGTDIEALQAFQKFRVRVWKSYSTHRSAG